MLRTNPMPNLDDYYELLSHLQAYNIAATSDEKGDKLDQIGIILSGLMTRVNTTAIRVSLSILVRDQGTQYPNLPEIATILEIINPILITHLSQNEFVNQLTLMLKNHQHTSEIGKKGIFAAINMLQRFTFEDILNAIYKFCEDRNIGTADLPADEDISHLITDARNQQYQATQQRLILIARNLQATHPEDDEDEAERHQEVSPRPSFSG